MKQVIIGGYYDALNTATSEYNPICGGYTWHADPDIRAQCVSSPGTFRNLRVELNDVPGTGTYVFTLYRRVGLGAWGLTTLTCTVAADGTTASDTAHDVTVAAGDVICLECNPDSPDNARYARWTMEFEGDNANESLILLSGYAFNTGTRYLPVMGHAIHDTIENYYRAVCPTSGKIKNLYVQMKDDPGTAPDAYEYTLRVNGADSDDGEGNPLQCTIVANGKTGDDTTHEIAVSAGNILTFKTVAISTPSSPSYIAVGMTFVADTDGESLILGGTESFLSTTATRYNYLIHGRAPAWSATELERYHLAQACVLKKLYILLSGDPGGTDKYTFTVRYDGGSPGGGLVVEIAGGSTTGNDTTNSITVSDGKVVNMMVVPTDTPALWVNSYWGLVCFIPSIQHYERSASVIIGNKVSASRALAIDRDAFVIIGELVTASRSLAVTRSATVLIGNLVSATFAIAVIRTASVIIGNLVSAIKSWNRTESSSVIVGVLVSATKAWSREVLASVIVGNLVLASRSIAVSRSSSVLVGILVAASRSISTTRASSVLIGVLTTATRSIATVRASSVIIGIVVSATKIFNSIQPSSVIVGIVATASKVAAISRASSVLIGVLVSATRNITVSRASSVIVGVVVTASRLAAVTRTATVSVGVLVTASKVFNSLNQSSVIVGILVSASRALTSARASSVLLGVLVTAQRAVTKVRYAALIIVGIVTTATRIKGRHRQSAVSIGIIVTAMFGLARKIKVFANTSQYRLITTITAQYRNVKGITFKGGS